jgi:SPP1 gp7 family putative phage head morphogenesis protein
MVREMRDVLREQLFPALERIETEAALNRTDGVRLDQVDEEIERVIGDVRIIFARRFSPDRIRDIAGTQATAINSFNRGDTERQIKNVLGIDLGTEPTIAPHLAEFVRENARLIADIPTKLMGEVEGVISRGVRRGRLASEMAKDIGKRLDVTESRAKLIARDQVSKLNGELAQLRQTSLGVRRYIWLTSRDERVRPSHEDRDGEVFSWDNPPADGHPGEPINCRCVAEPVLDDILEPARAPEPAPAAAAAPAAAPARAPARAARGAAPAPTPRQEARTESAARDQLRGTRFRDRVLTEKQLDARVAKAVSNVRRARTRGTIQKLEKQARTQHKAARARGARMNVSVAELVTPDPSRDPTPFRRALQTAKSKTELNRFTTGRATPQGQWAPQKPIELRNIDGDWSIQDGNHRLQAAIDAGATEIRAKLLQEDGSTSIVILPLKGRLRLPRRAPG